MILYRHIRGLASRVVGVSLLCACDLQVSEAEMRELLAVESELSVEEILLYRGVAG